MTTFREYVNSNNVFSALHDEHFKTDKEVLVELMNRLPYYTINQLM